MIQNDPPDPCQRLLNCRQGYRSQGQLWPCAILTWVSLTRRIDYHALAGPEGDQ